ncbi:hypothetical protein Pmar_PMAR028748 [Perkinsus marinus ATCC 50983]|uniref:Uncharacterized protein n=1 Tax=Perkinsus marinus (strain ATCC 50983 / TXsc) TaxID=423536 RepID=C5LUJ6_PERM5|nr:hypothetical protein Pmar_PMAR028748 [Perkinsus marinus ATCC 50983]EEQ99592.1 hypothetical protein Pmar_PMAR028748 [Perkinsus marinus ATCC 50983]|eukprot:XP_002766875.1 hypothetical protein Pmar_PMAR028748 [Perkinsus marinus ATCC 50983]
MAAVPVRRKCPRSPQEGVTLSAYEKHVAESATRAVPMGGVKSRGVQVEARPFGWVSLLWYLLVLLVSVVAMDVAASRFHYHYLIHYEIEPLKSKALEAMKDVNGTVKGNNLSCTVFDPFANRTVNDCSRSVCIFEAFRLAEKRQDVLQTVRQFHLAGRIGAEIFDWKRGVDQTAKPGNLFRTKSCEKIIDSVDHSNHEANVVAVVSGVISLLGFSILLVALLRSPRYQPAALPETRVSDTGKVQRRHKLD